MWIGDTNPKLDALMRDVAECDKPLLILTRYSAEAAKIFELCKKEGYRTGLFTGYKRKIGFEGGQMPLQRRVPKAGFKNINHKEYFAVNLSTLQALAEAKNLTKIGIAELKATGLTSGKELVKVLGNGELKAKLEVEANAFSKTAEEAIKAVGGNATII